MTEWTSEDLTKIGSADVLEIAALRPNGTIRNPVTIWVVPYDDDLYVRSVNGRGATWFRAAQVTHQGRIWADGVEKDVTFIEPAWHVGSDGETVRQIPIVALLLLDS